MTRGFVRIKEKTVKKFINKYAVRLLSLALCMVLAFGVVFVYPEATTVTNAANADVQQKQDELKALEKKQNELLNKINGLKSEEKKTAQYKADLDALLSTVSSKIDTANALIEELAARIEETEAAIAAHEEKIKETTEKFKERMRANHEAGSENYFSILIGAEDIGDFLSRVERVNALLEYDKNLQKKYKEEKAALEAERDALVESKKLHEATLTKLKADKAESERLASEAEKYISSLQADKSKYQAEYNKAKAAEKALDAEIEALLQDRLNQGASQQQTPSGAFMWPLPVGKGYVPCRYGGKDPNGAPHYAVDVAQIGHGCPIYASNSGTVVKAEWHYSYGYYVLIDHGGGYSTLYAHCSGLAVRAGQTVAKGQTISYAGSTGFSTGVHLHFEFRVNGRKVNALNYMKAGC